MNDPLWQRMNQEMRTGRCLACRHRLCWRCKRCRVLRCGTHDVSHCLGHGLIAWVRRFL